VSSDGPGEESRRNTTENDGIVSIESSLFERDPPRQTTLSTSKIHSSKHLEVSNRCVEWSFSFCPSRYRHLTTFITPWGRYRYKVAPQGFLSSGDGYTRRSDEIIQDVPRKTKCVEKTAIWDEDLEQHWWRTLDLLELLRET